MSWTGRWLLPMRIMMPLLLVLLSLAGTGLYYLLDLGREMREIEREALVLQYQDMHRAAAHLEYALLRRDTQAVEVELANLSTEPDTVWLALVDPSGTVIAASRRAWNGRKLAELAREEQLAEGAAEIFARTLKERAGHVHLDKDRTGMWAHFPVLMPANQGIRPQDFGVLLARFDLAPAKTAARAELQQAAVGVFILLTGAAFVLWLASQLVLGRRMRRIVDAAHRIAEGELGARSQVAGGDELGRIGRAFDAMAEELEAASQEAFRLRRAVQEMGEAMFITDTQGRIEFVNPAFSRITGYSFEEAVGSSPRILKSGEHDDAFYADLWKTLLGGGVWRGRMVNRRRDGTLYTAEMSAAPVRDGRGRITHFVAVQEDVTDRVQLERKIAEMQKMEALGTLVGGIAHDFNNMLAGMLGNLYMVRKKAGDPQVATLVDRVEKLGYRAADMIKQLLAFARQDVVEFRTLDLSAFIREAWKLASVSLPENVVVETRFAREPMPIRGDMTQLQQVLMNLLANARDAVADTPGPRILVELAAVEVDEDFRRRHGIEARRCARLVVADNGCGIPEQDLKRIFEPFFTTKEVGQGTGLGLAMTFGSVRRHGGAIEVWSQPGEGTRFSLYFPILEDQAEAVDETLEAHPVQGQRLLLADDERIVRESVGEMLETLGYAVDTAADGREALDRFRAAPHAYDAVVLDVVMPGMGGVEAALEMRRLREDLPIVLATGYDREHVLGQLGGMRGIAALSKPVHPAALQATLERMADELAANT